MKLEKETILKHEKRLAYMREWQRENIDHVLEYQRRYYYTHREEKLERDRARHQRNSMIRKQADHIETKLAM